MDDGGERKGLERGSGRKVVRRNWSKGLPWWNEKRFVFEERVGTVEGYVGLLLYTDTYRKYKMAEGSGWLRERERKRYGENKTTKVKWRTKLIHQIIIKINSSL